MMRRRFLALAVLACCAAGGAHAAKKEKDKAQGSFPFVLTAQDDAKQPIAGVAVAIASEVPDRFALSGVTDAAGKFQGEFPDFARVYRLTLTKPGWLPYDKDLDLLGAGLEKGMTAELGVTLLADTGPDPVALYNTGVEALQKNDLATAKEKFEAAAAKSPELYQAWAALAFLYLDEKNFDKALEAAERTLVAHPGDAQGLRSRYESLLGKKDPAAAAALDLLRDQVATPDTARLLYNAGVSAWNVKNAELARQRFGEALALDPKLFQAHSGIAETWIGAKQYEPALGELDAALAVSPANRAVLRRKVELLKAMGRAAEAAEVEKLLAPKSSG